MASTRSLGAETGCGTGTLVTDPPLISDSAITSPHG
jgi:hypothetical protein